MAASKPDHNAEPLTWDHDIDDPKAVTLELTKPFPKEALENREGFTYIKYPHMIRRLIRATGNRFSTRLVGQESVPFGATNPPAPRKPQEKVLLRAWVELDIPVLGSARTHEGVQVAFVGTGEDMYKGAVSDAIKKAAQSYGVGIELTGADVEWNMSQQLLNTPPQQEAPPPTPITNAHQRPAQDEPRALASPSQRNLIIGKWKALGYVVTGDDGKEHHDADELNKALAKKFKEANLTISLLTSKQASEVIDGLNKAVAEKERAVANG